MNLTETHTSLQEFRRDPFFRWTASASVTTLAFSLIIMFWAWNKLPPAIPFFYSLPWGEDQLGTPYGLIAFIGALFGIYLISSIWAYILYRRYTYYTRILLVGSASVVTLGVITLIQIILLVI